MTDDLVERVARALAGPRADEMVLAGNPLGDPCEYPRWMLHQLDARAAIAAMQADAAPVADRVSTSSPVDVSGSGNTSDKADTAPVVKSDTVLVSDKLRDAVEVWEDAYRAWDDAPTNPDRIGDEDRAAAAVIEADRAALVAEIVDWLDSQTEEYPAGNYAIFAKLIRDEIEAKWGGK